MVFIASVAHSCIQPFVDNFILIMINDFKTKITLFYNGEFWCPWIFGIVKFVMLIFHKES